MPKIEDATRHTLTELGVNDAETLAVLFFEQQGRFVSDLGRSLEDHTLPALRDAWMRSDDAVLNRIERNWTRRSPADLLQSASVELQRLRAFVGIRISASQPLEPPAGIDASSWIPAQFENLRIAFDGELKQCIDPADVGVTKTSCVRAKIRLSITETWLKRATPELKPIVGRELNKLRAHVEAQIEACGVSP